MTLRWKNGHVWCDKHNKWWKKCPCKGDITARFILDKKTMQACQARRGAFTELVDELLATAEEDQL